MDYEVTIVSTSKELTKKERIAIKDTSAMTSMDNESMVSGDFVIDVDYYALLQIHNEKAKDNTDYENIVVKDSQTGQFYYTGSKSFMKSFKAIADEMGDEPFGVKVYRRDSKNYNGKQFLNCTII